MGDSPAQASPGCCLCTPFCTLGTVRSPHMSPDTRPYGWGRMSGLSLCLCGCSWPVQAAWLSHAATASPCLGGAKPCTWSRGPNTKQDSLPASGSFWAFGGFHMGTPFPCSQVACLWRIRAIFFKSINNFTVKQECLTFCISELQEKVWSVESRP